MKKTAILAIAFAACACHKSEFDVTPNQVSKLHSGGPVAPMGMPDFKHLPPGAVKFNKVFKKGDRLPDGSIADRDGRYFKVEIPDAGGGGNAKVYGTQAGGKP